MDRDKDRLELQIPEIARKRGVRVDPATLCQDCQRQFLSPKRPFLVTSARAPRRWLRLVFALTCVALFALTCDLNSTSGLELRRDLSNTASQSDAPATPFLVVPVRAASTVAFQQRNKNHRRPRHAL